MCIYYSKGVPGLPDPRFAGTTPVPQYAPDRNFSTVHIKISLDIDIPKKSISGVCTTTLRSLNGKEELILNAVNFKIISVKDSSGKAFDYNYDNKKLSIKIGKMSVGREVNVVVAYKIVEPKLGIYFVGPEKHDQKKPVHVWSHNEPEEARYWFPVQDMPNDKSTSETIITVPSNFTAVSNGVLFEVRENKKEGRKTFHWKMKKPHSSYLINFTAGDFAEIKDKWKNVAVKYYCQKGREPEMVRAFGKTPQMIDFFSKKTGVQYPYEKYAQIAVANFIFGGMEHTTATTQTDDALHDERAHEEAKYFSEGLCAHELAHQWFGDLITCKDWSHIWLNESFATYFDALFTEHDNGREEFEYKLYQNAIQYFLEDKEDYRRPIVTNLYRRPNDLIDRHAYQKGSLVLHMIRSLVGDELWWKIINNYVKKNRDKSVETLDLINAIEETTGTNMKKFFDQWVFGAGHPEYKVLYYWDEKTKKARIHIAQSQPQETGLFSIRMKMEFVTRNGIKNFEEIVDQKEHSFEYNISSEPLMLRIDPDNTILKKMDVIKSKNMWTYQLQFDKNVAGRIAAAAEIAKYGTSKDSEILGKAMLKESFWGVQAEIAAYLGKMKNQTALEYLIKGLSIKSPLARRACVAALGEFRDPKIIVFLKPLLDDDKSYLVPSETCRTIGKAGDASFEYILKSMLEKDSWLDAIRVGAIDGLAQMHGSESVDMMKKYSQQGSTYRTRAAAIRNLAMFGKGRKDVLDTLTALANDEFVLIQIAAAAALGDLGDERSIDVLEKLTKGDRDGRLKRAAEDSIKKLYTWLDTDIDTYKVAQEVKKKLLNDIQK